MIRWKQKKSGFMSYGGFGHVETALLMNFELNVRSPATYWKIRFLPLGFRHNFVFLTFRYRFCFLCSISSLPLFIGILNHFFFIFAYSLFFLLQTTVDLWVLKIEKRFKIQRNNFVYIACDSLISAHNFLPIKKRIQNKFNEFTVRSYNGSFLILKFDARKWNEILL